MYACRHTHRWGSAVHSSVLEDQVKKNASRNPSLPFPTPVPARHDSAPLIGGGNRNYLNPVPSQDHYGQDRKKERQQSRGAVYGHVTPCHVAPKPSSQVTLTITRGGATAQHSTTSASTSPTSPSTPQQKARGDIRWHRTCRLSTHRIPSLRRRRPTLLP